MKSRWRVWMVCLNKQMDHSCWCVQNSETKRRLVPYFSGTDLANGLLNDALRLVNRSRPNWITGSEPKSEPAGKSESRGPENWVSWWRRPNSDIYSQNHHFGIVYDMIYQFIGMEAKNYKFGMFCQQCHPSVASGDADIRPRNASRIHTCHLFTS